MPGTRHALGKHPVPLPGPHTTPALESDSRCLQPSKAGICLSGHIPFSSLAAFSLPERLAPSCVRQGEVTAGPPQRSFCVQNAAHTVLGVFSHNLLWASAG